MEKRQLGRTEHSSSILIFGGFALFRVTQKAADAAIETALEAGINHIDVAPSYGDAEKHLGSWFKRHGSKQFFLGCKTHERLKEGAKESLLRSLDNLKVDHFDLFQLHGVDTHEVLDTVLKPGGAMEAILEAKEQGLVRFIGITGHHPPLHNEALQRFDFDTVMFPLNRVHAVHPTDWNNYRPLLKTAKQRNVGVMAIKSVAKQAWPDRQANVHHYNTWYQPFDEATEIEKSVWFTLSQDITAAVLPGELSLWPMIISAAQRFKPLDKKTQQEYMNDAAQYQPLAGPQMD
ncbi:MAG: aldo/keto reductase [Dehalococcoidales bacterium]|jgi:aryl-alcohol dehydrogenase-like predicted oxidoreductase